MMGTLTSVTVLLLSLVIMLMGHGLQLTVIPLFATELGWATPLIGYTGSAYFVGFVLGCLTIPRLVTGVGHIRVFMVLCAAATSALLLLGLVQDFVWWVVGRLITGWAMAGVYMVIESWLNERSTTENRGFILSIYTTLTLLSISLGQLAIGFNLSSISLIMLAAILLALGAIPIGLTSSPAPPPLARVGFQFRIVYRASHVAVIGAFVSGLVTSGFWVLGPVVASSLNLEASHIGYFLALTILGGAILQLPVGRFSDRFDRRKVLVGLAIGGVIVCTLIILYGTRSPVLILGLMFLFGGMTFPLYSISLAHANDHTSLPLIETGSVILLTYSAGAVIGPIIISWVMATLPGGLFGYTAGVLALFAVWSLWRIKSHPVSRPHFEPFPDIPRTTHEMLEMRHEPLPEEASAESADPDETSGEPPQSRDSAG